MSNYTKTVDFAAKDSLSSGDSGKVIKGTEFETEFDNIVTAIATKADAAGPTFTGTATFETLSDGTIAVVAFADEDDMSSDSATLVPTQQSVKAYVDSQAGDMQFVLEDGDGTEVQVTKDKEVKFVEGGGVDINWTDTDNGTDGDPYDLTFTINAAQTGITSIYATDLILGEDAETAIDFGTANEIAFKADNAGRLILTASAFYPVTNNQIDLGTSSLEFKDAFFDGIVTADAFAGPLTGNVTGNASGSAATVTGAAQSNITSLGTLTTLTVDSIIINGTTIGHTGDIDLLTFASGVLTVAGEVSMTTLDIGGTNVTSTAAELNKLASAGTLKQAGKETIWVPSAAMQPTTSNGCSDLTTVETTSGRPDMVVLDFDKDSDEFAQFSVAFPKSWNLGTVTFQVFWAGIAATSDCDWMVDAVAMNDNETIDVAYGTAIVVTDNAQGAVEELLVSAESGALTIAGTPADNDLCFFRVGRDVSGDSMAGDARLIGIKIFFTTDAANDA